MTEPTSPDVPEPPVTLETKPVTEAAAVTLETKPVTEAAAVTLETKPVTERQDTLVSMPAAETAVVATADAGIAPAEPKVQEVGPMTRESALDPKEPEKKPVEPRPSDLWGVLWSILSTPWGRKVALVIVGIVLLFTGYVSGNWGQSDLESKLSDRNAEILKYKKEKAALAVEVASLSRQRDELDQKLRDSEEKREFYRQRDKIRKYLADSRKAWEARNVKEALEALHKANIHFQSETRAAKGVSNYLYRTITRRLNEALTAMETDCADTRPVQKSAFEPAPVPAVTCLDRVNVLLQQVLDALPPVRED